MKKKLPSRIVTREEEGWRIRPDAGELDAAEVEELKAYFDEIRLPYRIVQGRLCVSGSLEWQTLDERLVRFYDGRAEVYPF